LWGSGPLAFFSGLVLSAAINILTGLALLRTGDWPSRGRTLLLGSFFLASGSAVFALLAARIQPLKSRSDERLWQRNQIVAKDEQHRTDIEFLWREVVDAVGKGIVLQDI
jgi:hypothetical protein